jgi:serine/threonine-protein kinase
MCSVGLAKRPEPSQSEIAFMSNLVTSATNSPPLNSLGDQPTLEMESLPAIDRPPVQSNLDVIRQEKKQRFADETEALLCGRLKAAAIDLIIVLGLGYIGNLLIGNSHWLAVRTIILAMAIACWLFLRSQIVLKMVALRSIEAALFGGVAVQMSLMMYSLTEDFAAQGDATSMISVQQFFFTAFCLHILTYGIFMPNTWQRAAVVTVILACVPYAIQFSQVRWNPDVARLSAENHAGMPIPVTFIAALIGSFGSHIIQRTRREAFHAKQIMQYQLHEKIGTGGMGDVYRAEHVLLKRRCAMKLIKQEKDQDADCLANFEREVIATARLSHWNTIEIYDYGHTEDGTFYYVMELLEGDSLQSLVTKHGPLPPARVIYLLAQACDALHEAHASGLIHRDIKPANLFVAKRGGIWDVLKLLDFGLVREVSSVD